MRSLRILLVDDYPDTLELVKSVLVTKGFSVSTATNGHQALDAIEKANRSNEPYDAVLLDYAMPGMSGLGCALRIRDEGDDKFQPKIGFFSAYKDLEVPENIRKKIDARHWDKAEPLQLINDLDEWLEIPCERVNAVC